MDNSEALTAYDDLARRDHAGIGEQIDIEADSMYGIGRPRFSRPSLSDPEVLGQQRERAANC